MVKDGLMGVKRLVVMVGLIKEHVKGLYVLYVMH